MYNNKCIIIMKYSVWFLGIAHTSHSITIVLILHSRYPRYNITPVTMGGGDSMI